MKGKKTDKQFIAQFIFDAVENGLVTPEEMVQSAKDKIAEIDEAIKQIEAKKVLRSKLVDIVAEFEPSKNKEEEAKLLPFLNMPYPDICAPIYKIVKDSLGVTSDYIFSKYAKDSLQEVATFCIKYLIELEIIQLRAGLLYLGKKFPEYETFLSIGITK